MHHDLAAALCLVLVIEGVFLFAAPHAWRRMAERMREIEPRKLRMVGAAMMAVGVIALQLVN